MNTAAGFDAASRRAHPRSVALGVRRRVIRRVQRWVGKRLDTRLDRAVARELDKRLDRAVVPRVDDRLRELEQVGALDGWRLKASLKAVREGRGLVMHVIDLCELQRDQTVLEIGCGGGGPALHLAGYLSEEGRYEGLDIKSGKIEKCQRVIAARHPNFHFQVADVYNRNYNPAGKYKASEYRSPFDDESIDVAFLGSVFTHMLPPDVENYLCQISRVLKKRGRCLITYFLINEASQQCIEAGLAGKTFAHHYENYRAEDPNVHERAVGLPEDFVRGLYEKCGLQIMEPIHYGYWCGRQQFLSKQDITAACVRVDPARRKASPARLTCSTSRPPWPIGSASSLRNSLSGKLAGLTAR